MRLYSLFKSDLMIQAQLGDALTGLGFELLLAAACVYIRMSEDLNCNSCTWVKVDVSDSSVSRAGEWKTDTEWAESKTGAMPIYCQYMYIQVVWSRAAGTRWFVSQKLVISFVPKEMILTERKKLIRDNGIGEISFITFPQSLNSPKNGRLTH